MPRYPRQLHEPYIPSADGALWYIALGVPQHLLNIYETLVIAAEVAERRAVLGGDSSGQAQSLAIDLLISQIRTRMDEIAVATATAAQDAAVSNVASTARRVPTTAGHLNKQSHLMDSIRCKPILLPGLAVRGLGAVGVGEIRVLEAGTVNPITGSQKGYWQAQEDGSAHMVGRRIPGVFQPGEAPPDQASFRAHPIFEKRPPGALRFSMKIGKPIEARHFLKDGAGDGYEYRKLALRSLEAFILDELALIETGSHPSLARVRNALRRIR